ncbi:MAG: Ig-like domain-containing protein [Anaeromyxobacteraceae bacterium]
MSFRLTSLAVLSAALATACGGGSSDPAPAPVASVTVTLGSSNISVGGGTLASAVLKDAGGNVLGGRAITWSSSPSSVATVSVSGGVTAVAAGTASITATSEGQSGSATVTVTVLPVSTVTVTLPSPLGIGQTGQATAVARDANGGAITGKTFTWNSLTPSVATVSASGLVTGVAVGTSTIEATSDGVSGTALVTVLAAAGLPTQMVAVSATSQTGPPSFAAAQAPAVLVTDASGTPVSGVSVTFSVTGGGGTLVGGAATTDGFGKARATAWNFGPVGAQSVRASSAAIPGVTVDFAGLSRVSTQAFDITLRFISSMSDSQARAFVNAKERIQQFIVGDLPLQNVSLSASQMASCGGVSVQQDVDDVLILAEVGPIDGVNNVLGQAGPCYVRTPGTPWPVVGHMMFDTADLEALEAAGRLEYVILHEMMHVIGFGTIWTDMGLLLNPATSGGTDPTFSGANAISNLATYNNGAFYSGAKVPVEATGGAGTRDSHWRESVFNHELMTGFLDTGVNPISATTIGSFQDLGYVVDVTKADAFNLATALRMDWLAAVEPPFRLGSDVKPEPFGFIGPDGKPIGR